jgi:hypothetical protein
MRDYLYSLFSSLIVTVFIISTGYSAPAQSSEPAEGSSDLAAGLAFKNIVDLESEDSVNRDSEDLQYLLSPSGPGARGVQCKAVNERGVPFYGSGPNMPSARDAALRRCRQVSRRCTMEGCRPI